MNKTSIVLIGFIFMSFLPESSAEGEKPAPPVATLNLWPEGKMPGIGAQKPEETKLAKSGEISQITNVSIPTIAVYRASGATSATPAIMICPGGGYGLLAYTHEGTEVARWLNTMGITGIVLKYRVPGNRPGAFQDIQRAMRLVRTHAKEWSIDPARVGVMGFSAGGHLGAKLSTNFDQAAYPKIDDVDDAGCRPDFTILVYPAYLAGKDGKLLPEFPITARTPPAFIVHTEDDLPHIPDSRAYVAALQAANIPCEFCLFATGGHGYGLHCNLEARVWPQRCQDWLNKSGILGETGTGK